MLVRVECKVCDLTLSTCSISYPGYTTIERLVKIAKDHCSFTGHTLIKVVMDFTYQELKGD